MDAQLIEYIHATPELEEAIRDVVSKHKEMLNKGWGAIHLYLKYSDHRLSQCELQINQVRQAVKK